MLGFMIVPMVIGVVSIFAVCVVRKQRPSFWPVFGLLGSLAVLGFVIFWFAGLLEFPCAYAFTLLRIPDATSVNGVPVSKLIKGAGNYWVTDDYFSDLCGDYDNLTTIRLETPSNTTDYYFAYDSRTRVLVPMTDAAAECFPAFMPSDDKLVGVYELNGGTNRVNGFVSTMTMGNNEIKLPAKWFRASVKGSKRGTHYNRYN